MSNPTIPSHSFVRPGQVDSFDSPPDHCMRCGEPLAAHPAGTYAEEASIADQILDQKLLELSIAPRHCGA
jgi:hypothetical protein